METIILYILFTGCIYASWLYDISDKWWINAMNIVGCKVSAGWIRKKEK